MKYMLLSDIHGSLSRLNVALDIYRQEHCDMLLLLGDILNYGPRNGLPEGLDARGVAEALNQFADEIVAVRGNCDSEVDQMLLRFPMLDTCALLVDEGRKILLTHGHVYNKENLPPGRFDAVVYGHTHLWELDNSNLKSQNSQLKSQNSNLKTQCSKPKASIICNTGSITFPKGGRVPTFGIMDNGVITIRDLQNNILATAQL